MSEFASNRPSRRRRNRPSDYDDLEVVPVAPTPSRSFYGATPVNPFATIPGTTHNYNGKGRKNQKGYKAPNQGYITPNQGYKAPNPGYNAPNQGRKHVVPGISPPHHNGNGIFDGQAIGYHGSGAGAVFRASPVAAQPFTSAALRLQQQHPSNPFSNLPWPKKNQQKAQGYDFVRACVLDHDGNPLFDPSATPDPFYLQYLSQISDGRSELHPVFRTRALQQLLDVGSVEQVCAEVFHFVSGVLQCKYGDGYMRDDLIMCDCQGTVPVCFMRAYLDERLRAESFRLRAEQAEAQLCGTAIRADTAVIL